MLLQRYLIAGLLLCLTSAVMMSEGKTYSKKLIKMDQVRNDGQVIVKKSGTDEMAGQYFCHSGSCNISYCVKCFETESEYLVLIMHNINHLDRFDANLNGRTPFLPNFTLDEDVSSTSTTTAVPDETHIQEPLHNATVPEALAIGAKVAIPIGVIVALVIVLVIADKAKARKAGRDAITTKAFRYLRGMFHNRKPKKQQEEDPREMDTFVQNQNEV